MIANMRWWWSPHIFCVSQNYYITVYTCPRLAAALKCLLYYCALFVQGGETCVTTTAKCAQILYNKKTNKSYERRLGTPTIYTLQYARCHRLYNLSREWERGFRAWFASPRVLADTIYDEQKRPFKCRDVAVCRITCFRELVQRKMC